MNKKYILGLFIITLFAACAPQIDEFNTSPGSADFTKYVALGNSLTAGFADNALYAEGQKNSFPNMLAAQFAKVGMQSTFEQPLMPAGDGVGVSGTTYHTRLVLGVVNGSFSPVLSDETIDQTTLQNTLLSSVFADQGPFNNFGVPGAKVAHLLAPGYGNPANLLTNPPTANPYYVRFASSASTSVVADAMAQNPSFFTLWIGNNDVLGYATSGGAGDVITPLEGAPGVGFVASLTAIVQTLTASDAKGAIANIPEVTSIPFFTTVPYNALVLTSQAQVDALDQAYAPLGITFQLGQNALIIEDASAQGGIRQIQNGELVLLSALTNIRASGWGSQIPIPDAYVLNATEINEIEAAVAGYNTAIANIADTYGLALVDVHSVLGNLETGLVFDGVSVSADFITGGVFSLDGVHLNPRGYGIVANYFIEAINTKYNARVPMVNISGLPGVEFP